MIESEARWRSTTGPAGSSPGRTQLVSRRASMFAEGVSPVYAQRAKGSRFIDVDGNEYIDWINCVSAVILGHADPVVDGAVKEQIDRGSLYSVNSPAEIELAELLVDTIPSAEMVRYCKGGGEACTIAVKIARGTTGRDKILFSGYHGWHDWYQSVNYLADPDTGEFPIAGIEPIGVPKVLAGTALPFTYGELNSLERLFAENRGEVAAVIMEPLRSDIPPEGYLEGVKEIAEANDALLIFDEVSCGWRTRIGGIQEYAGVTPGHVRLCQVDEQRLPDGRRSRLPRCDGAGRPDVHLQLLLERQRGPDSLTGHDKRAEAPRPRRRGSRASARKRGPPSKAPSTRPAFPRRSQAGTTDAT